MNVQMDLESKRHKATHTSLLSMGSFVLRSKALQARRAVINTVARVPRLKEGVVADFPFVLAESAFVRSVIPASGCYCSGRLKIYGWRAVRFITVFLIAGGSSAFGAKWVLRGECADS
jgi:hypothetical protein